MVGVSLALFFQEEDKRYRSKKMTPSYGSTCPLPFILNPQNFKFRNKIIFLEPNSKTAPKQFLKRVAREQLRSPVVRLFGWFSVSRPVFFPGNPELKDMI